jgi:hypothetical protein
LTMGSLEAGSCFDVARREPGRAFVRRQTEAATITCWVCGIVNGIGHLVGMRVLVYDKRACVFV